MLCNQGMIIARFSKQFVITSPIKYDELCGVKQKCINCNVNMNIS